jgi:hypothetical protein
VHRISIGFLILLLAAATAATQADSLVGTLELDRGRPVLKTAAGALVRLEGDAATQAVLADVRLHGRRLELVGKAVAADRFEVGPIHLKSMYVIDGGRRLLISYWCDVCAIRTYTPGKCQCCQEETALELRAADKP